MATTEKRGKYQYRVKIRRRGIETSKTFETLRDAKEWAVLTEGKITGRVYQDLRPAERTSIFQALEWFADQIAPKDDTGERRPGSHWARCQLSHVRYWQASDFAPWSLLGLEAWDLITWRRRVLDEDGAELGEAEGPEAECSTQTALHRLNTLSQMYKTWPQAHRIKVPNPVAEPNVRPSAPGGRKRRLSEVRDAHGLDEEARLLEAAGRSSRPWLRAAVVIALETCLRQAELAGLTWSRVHLEPPYPHLVLDETKNELGRTVPLSTRAVAAFRSLLPGGGVQVGPGPVFEFKTPRAIAHAFRNAVTDEAFPDLRWHDLRHEAISRLFEHTDLRDMEIMAITGHLSSQMLLRYTHLRAARLAARLG